MIGFFSGVGAPKTNRYTQITLVSDNHVATIFHHSSLFDVNLGKSSNLNYTPNRIDGAHLLEVINVLDRVEAETLCHNA